MVKVFVVLYDFNDMPCNTHTFLRQKIVSVKTDIDDQVIFLFDIPKFILYGRSFIFIFERPKCADNLENFLAPAFSIAF